MKSPYYRQEKMNICIELKHYREQIETLTAVEAKLQRLNQDYDTAKGKYDELVGREAEVTLTIEQSEKR